MASSEVAIPQITDLYRSVADLGGIINQATLIEAIPLSLHNALGFENIFLFLVDRGKLKHASQYLLSPLPEKTFRALSGLHLKLDQNPGLRKAFQNKTIILEKKPKPTLGKDRNLGKLVKLLKPAALLLVPLAFADEALGLLWINLDPKKKISDRLLSALKVFADSASLALENAFLYREAWETSKTYRSILEQLGDGVIMIEPDNKISLYNAAAEEMLNFPPEEILHRKDLDVLHINDWHGKRLSGGEESLSNLVAKTGVYAGNAFIRALDNHLVAVSAFVRQIRSTRNEVAGTVFIFRNISKELETERTRREFVYLASHELRTPLTAIKGFLDMIVEGDAGEANPTVIEYVKNAYEGVERLLRLVEDLLNVSRIEEGKISINPQSVEIVSEIKTLISDLLPTAQRRGLYLEFEPPTKDIPPIEVDPDRLREIMVNLVGNAIKFTNSGGVTVALQSKGEELIISIKDTGIGIAEKDLPNLFKRFYRVAISTAAEKHGTGLGLYIVKTLIEMMGGRVWVESKLGQGSTFSFSIPTKPVGDLVKSE